MNTLERQIVDKMRTGTTLKLIPGCVLMYVGFKATLKHWFLGLNRLGQRGEDAVHGLMRRGVVQRHTVDANGTELYVLATPAGEAA